MVFVSPPGRHQERFQALLAATLGPHGARKRPGGALKPPWDPLRAALGRLRALLGSFWALWEAKMRQVRSKMHLEAYQHQKREFSPNTTNSNTGALNLTQK